MSAFVLLKPFRAFSPWATTLLPLAVIALLLADPASSLAGRRTRRTTAGSATSQPGTQSSMARAKNGQPSLGESVDLFDAVKAGKVAVRFIPKDSTQARVFVKNKTGKPLNVRLPAAFAAVPVLAQMGMGGMGMGGMNMGGGGGQGMGGGGGGMFNIPADKEMAVRVPCVCLEHGKPEPRPQMSYSMQPIDSFTTKPGVAELLTELGDGAVSQRAVQAAAWHLNNDMSWEQLASKQIERANGISYPYFSAAEVQAGIALAERSVAAAKMSEKAEPKQPSPGETAAAR